ncbi:MAG: biotin--[acetyl-CoA-carboxylase] ligase [Planctomycetes bacterium]|nr:biotin--[acetyl-CoA-carboxylase] ligase [Planctomycetota bacterium]
MSGSPPPVILDWIRSASFVRQVEWHDTIGSTNDRGNELAKNRELETPLLIMAGEQTAGRGRGGNRWWSGPGALTFTLVFNPLDDLTACGLRPVPTDYWPRVALVAGVSLCDVLQASIPATACQLKWPNDVLLGGKKVAGILAEVPPAGPDVPRRLVLGLGVNVNNSLAAAPPEIQAVAAALCDLSEERLDSAQILVDWLNMFSDRLDRLAAQDRALAERWQSLCVLRGKTIELQSGSRLVRGLCRGIDTDGALLLDTPQGPERLYAGVLVRVVPAS